MSDLTKVTVNLIPEAWRAIEAASDRSGLTNTEVINRAVQLYEVINRPILLTGRTIKDTDDPGLTIHVSRKRKWWHR